MASDSPFLCMRFHSFDQAFSQNLKVLQNCFYVGNTNQLIVQSCHCSSFHIGDLQGINKHYTKGNTSSELLCNLYKPKTTDVNCSSALLHTTPTTPLYHFLVTAQCHWSCSAKTAREEEKQLPEHDEDGKKVHRHMEKPV